MRIPAPDEKGPRRRGPQAIGTIDRRRKSREAPLPTRPALRLHYERLETALTFAEILGPGVTLPAACHSNRWTAGSGDERAGSGVGGRAASRVGAAREPRHVCVTAGCVRLRDRPARWSHAATLRLASRPSPCCSRRWWPASFIPLVRASIGDRSALDSTLAARSLRPTGDVACGREAGARTPQPTSSGGAGFPARLLAPGGRGFWWVKW
jgi:hypothetical protein